MQAWQESRASVYQQDPQRTEKCKLKSKRETKIKLTTSSTKQYGDRVICLGLTNKLLQTTRRKLAVPMRCMDLNCGCVYVCAVCVYMGVDAWYRHRCICTCVNMHIEA